MKESPILLLIPTIILMVGAAILFMPERQVSKKEDSGAVQASSKEGCFGRKDFF
jgi:hypothetical protein